jgi:hypothetical protein
MLYKIFGLNWETFSGFQHKKSERYNFPLNTRRKFGKEKRKKGKKEKRKNISKLSLHFSNTKVLPNEDRVLGNSRFLVKLNFSIDK